MNIIDKLKKEFQSGKCSKEAFISKMHEIHKSLFEYSEILKDTDISKIEITDSSVVMTTREQGIKITCDMYDERIIPLEIINFGEFEGDELRAIRKIIKNDWTVFDVGANVGWYSLNLVKSLSNLNVIAFEPVPSTFKYLLDNLALNDVNNVSAHNLGLSNEEGAKEMFTYREGMGNASLLDLSQREGVEKVSTQFTTMDIFTAKHSLKPDFVKCDVEGAELFVFQGAVETLKRDKPVVFTEMLRKWSAKFNYHPNDIIDFFSGLGYHCYTIENDAFKKFDRVDDQTTETNYLFIHPDKISV